MGEHSFEDVDISRFSDEDHRSPPIYREDIRISTS